MKKILYITTIGGTMGFFKKFIKQLVDKGVIVDIATNCSISKIPDVYSSMNCQIFDIDCNRSPLKFGNIKAIFQIRKIVKNGGYDIVHCHTPIAAACARLACMHLRSKGVRVIYTAHGFHFYKGAPLKNWLVYYPLEKFCSRFTDCLITITKEDFELAKNKFKASSVEYIAGVGIDVDSFANSNVNITEKRTSIGVPKDAFLLFSVGELNTNKNHKIVLEALSKINDSKIHYAIAGKGPILEKLISYSENLNLSGKVHFLGYRKDVAELYQCADAYILPSIREGLNVSIMEAMASGLPVLCGDIRGNRDIVNSDVGYLFNPRDVDTVCTSINAILGRSKIEFSHNADIAKDVFDFKKMSHMLEQIYFN